MKLQSYSSRHRPSDDPVERQPCLHISHHRATTPLGRGNMLRVKGVLLLALALGLALVECSEPDLAKILLPQPQEIGPPSSGGGGPPIVLSAVAICVEGLGEGGGGSRIWGAVQRIAGGKLPSGSVGILAGGSCEDEIPPGGSVMVILKLQGGTEGVVGGYEMEVGQEGISIRGDERGLFYGLGTLLQIIVLRSQLTSQKGSAWPSLLGDERLPPGASVPSMHIKDWPSVPNRGVMMDVSRNRVHSLRTLKHVVDLISATKMTQLQLYTEHTYAYEGHEDVWKGTGALTRGDIEELSEYCHERFIELVPNQQSLGHMQHWLKLPSNRHLAEDPAGQQALHRGDYCCSMWGDEKSIPYSLAPTNESLSFLASLYDQLLPVFRHSSSINVGLDETFDLGTGRSRGEASTHGKNAVYMRFLRSLRGVLSERRRTVQFWGDVISSDIKSIMRVPEDAIIMEWGYEADSPFAQKGAVYHTHNVRYYNCPGTSSWNTLGGRTDNALVNVYRAAAAATEHGAEGVLVTDWGDNGHLQPLPVSYVGYLGAADFTWNVEAAEQTLSSGASAFARISRAIDHLVLADAAGVVGALLVEIGLLYRRVGRARISNRSALFNLLVLPNRDTATPLVSIGWEVTRDGLQAAAGELEEFSKRLEDVSMAGPDASLVKKEVLWVIRVLAVACKIGLLCVGQGSHRCDYRRLPTEDGAPVGVELSELVGELRELWPHRAAAGSGLDDSEARLMHTATLLMGKESKDASSARFAAKGSQQARSEASKGFVKTVMEGLGMAGGKWEL